MRTLKQAALNAAFLAAHAYSLRAWKAGSDGAGNLFIALVVFISAAVLHHVEHRHQEGQHA